MLLVNRLLVKVSALATVLGIWFLPITVGATTITFTIDTEFSGGTDSSGDPVAIFDDGGGSGSVTLTLDLTNLTTSGEFVDAWYFNFDPSLNLSLLSFSYGGSSSGPAATVSVGTDAFKADGDGYFDILFDFPPPPGSVHFDAGEVVVYTITSSQPITAQSFNFTSAPGGGNGTFGSAAHVQGIGPDNQDSGWVGGDGGTQLPIPSTGLLLGIGLIGLGWVQRRLQKTV